MVLFGARTRCPSVARGVWYSEVCTQERELRELCLVAVIGEERPLKATGEWWLEGERQTEDSWVH